MSHARPKRLARLAACTALAVSAGALLGAGPAVAGPVPGTSAVVGAERPQAEPSASPERPQAEPSGAQRSTYATGRSKPRLDLDGDGYSDFLFRTLSGKSWVFLTGSSGGEAPEFTIPGSDTQQAKDIIQVGNLRGSAAPELLTLSPSGRLSLRTTNGTSASAPLWTGTGWQMYNRVFGAGDLNRDGRQDLLARTPGGTLYLYRGNGASSGNPFSAPVKVGTGWGVYDQLVGAGDVDGDGTGDLVARTTYGNLFFYKGTGSTSSPFRARVKIGPGWNAYNTLFSNDDINGDGRADLLARSAGGTLYCYFGTSAGKFSARSNCATGWQYTTLLVGGGITPNYGKHSVLGLDGTGTTWQYAASASGKLSDKWQASDTGIWQGSPRLTYGTGLSERDWASLLELHEGELYNYSDDSAIPGDWSATELVAGPGDLNGDGRGDLISRDTSGVLWLHPGDGTGKKVGSRVRVGSGWGSYEELVGGGDVTGDGRADLVARDGGTLYLYKGTGKASAPFGSRVKVGTGWSGYTKLVSPGDINGDGRADLLARDGAGNLYRYTATGHSGTATFAARVGIGSGWNVYKNLV
ncbi:FG-GAP repeat domain-containing protein [Streptomyces sp. NPDC101118]|uniref:FG-GAP repeat domain-containing protein n=1 Tax=Streptomyces sp. NPDC101118 TaxID=3366109 RepID=UPI0038126159